MGFFRGRLPSIWVLVAATALLFAAPLVGVSVVQWNEANSRVAAAQEVAESANRLETLLRLTQALSAEQLSMSWAAESSGVLAELPPGTLESFGLDFGLSSEGDISAVDELAGTAGLEELNQSIRNVRSLSPGSTTLDVGNSYDYVIRQAGSAVDAELAALNDAAVRAGKPHVGVTARVANEVASVSLASNGQSARWAQLMAASVLQPTLVDVQRFTTNLTSYQERVRSLESTLRGGPVAARWSALASDPRTIEVDRLFEQLANELAVTGVAETSEESAEIDLSNVDVFEILSLATDVSEGLNVADEVATELLAVEELALSEVGLAAKEAVEEAQADRRTTLIEIVGSMALFLGAIAGLAILVGRPVREMGDTARRLANGQLDARLKERGPKELRDGARSLNHALSSLQIAEAQAVALAEERLDDPILQHSAPGELGASLQAAVSRLTGSLTERDDFQRRLAFEAGHDGLTKLPNRKSILSKLEAGLARASRSGTSIALLFVDLDSFKAINDAHGHYAGDMVLRTVSHRLVDALRTTDSVGRLGGDEFVVVAEHVHNVEEATALSERILDIIRQPITFEGVTFSPSASLGVALSEPQLTADELLRDADLAGYRAKSKGKGRFQICDEQLRDELNEQTSLEHAIRQALDQDEFVLHFQQCVDAVSKRSTSFEALIRWERPMHGLVFPDSFIPVAERSDLVLDIDRWVLRQAAKQLAIWRDDPILGPLGLAVNISSRHLGSGTLFDDVQKALVASDIDPQRLVLEITETSILADLPAAAKELKALRETGITIALDDFGTGYMSLAHLRGLPIDIIKVDRSFVAAMDSTEDHSLVQLIIDTGHLLGASITAEGVETQAQADTLVQMGSDNLQGYFFSRPANVQAIEKQVRSAAAKT